MFGRNSQIFYRVAFAAVLLPFVISASVADTPTAAVNGSASAKLFAASFKDFDRQLQPLSQFRGQPMVVYFWATWCASCQQEVPELKALYEKYKDRHLRVIGISADNTDKVLAFSKAQEITYTLLLGGNDALALSRDLGNSVGGLPFTVFVDAKGNIVDKVLGAAPPGKFEQVVRPLL